MEPFASTTLMEARSQGAITVATHPYLANELLAATRAIKSYCGWHIAPRQTITNRIRTRRWENIWIPAMQISTVTITTPDTVDHVLAQEDFDPDTGWTSWSGNAFAIQFTAGFETVPEDIADLTLQMASRMLGSPLGIVREQAGSVSVTYSQPAFNVAGGTVLLAHEKAALAAYKLGRLP